MFPYALDEHCPVVHSALARIADFMRLPGNAPHFRTCTQRAELRRRVFDEAICVSAVYSTWRVECTNRPDRQQAAFVRFANPWRSRVDSSGQRVCGLLYHPVLPVESRHALSTYCAHLRRSSLVVALSVSVIEFRGPRTIVLAAQRRARLVCVGQDHAHCVCISLTLRARVEQRRGTWRRWCSAFTRRR